MESIKNLYKTIHILTKSQTNGIIDKQIL